MEAKTVMGKNTECLDNMAGSVDSLKSAIAAEKGIAAVLLCRSRLQE